MKKKSYIIQFLVKHSGLEEKVIRRSLSDFWKRNPLKGVDGNCGYIVNCHWQHTNAKEVAKILMNDILKGGKEYNPPHTEQYWAIMTDPKEVRRLKYKYLNR